MTLAGAEGATPQWWLALLGVTVLLAGCAGAPLSGLDGERCLGVLPTVQGLRPLPDGALSAEAKAPAGQGKLCAGRSYVVASPVTLYRLWDSTGPHTEFGAWWALEPPLEPRDAYRRKYAICASWSRLDRVVTCTAQPGALVVLGTGQSVTCDPPEPPLPRTAAVQAYLPERAASLVACASSEWPPAAAR